MLEVEGGEVVAAALIELGLKLHPVETQQVEESAQPFHQQQDAQRQVGPEEEDDKEDDAPDVLASNGQTHVHHHGPQHFRQF